MNTQNRTIFEGDNGLPSEIGILDSSLKKVADETLFLELALRGYDLSSLRDDEPTTAKIAKIG